jgi:hypothetical protein
MFFSRIQRRVLRFASFESVSDLSERVLGYIEYWNKHEHKPYRWKFRGYPLQEVRSAA